MATGMRVVWEKGERTLVSGKDQKGKTIVRTGKNGGPVVSQLVTKRLVPKEDS